MSSPYSRTHPFLSRVLERRLLSDPSSTKRTYHIVLDLKGSNIRYLPGDSIAILPENDPVVVTDWLKRLGCLGDPEAEAHLRLRANLSRPAEHPSKFPPLLPRFYSIASSYTCYPEEVHLLVAHVEGGVATSFLCNRAVIGETPIPLYLHPTHTFRLPQNPQTPIILVGPGTGVAPYRAFLQERFAQRSFGPSWLFFGERNRAYDFYYQEEWLSWQEKGHLRLDLAFSRDGEEKTYVQHKLYENRRDIWDWLKKGAHFYVCGDAKVMAKDVEATLKHIFQEEGCLTEEDAKGYLKLLRTEKRYLTDVY